MTEVRSYHGQAILKQPTWTWEIPCYLFTGGLAGASAGLAYLSDLRGNEVLARRAWGIALTGMAVSPCLLISDLGRPARCSPTRRSQLGTTAVGCCRSCSPPVPP